MLSRTYRLSGDYDPSCWSVDPDNRLLWRHSPRRLDSESIRDSLLSISGNLNPVAGGPTLPPAAWVSGGSAEFSQIDDLDAVAEDVLRRRSIYLPVGRTMRHFKGSEPLRRFDFPPPNEITGARQSSTVPTQSLFMMNSPFVRRQADKLAERLLARDAQSETDRMHRLFFAAYGRPGSPGEIRRGAEYLAGSGGESKTDLQVAAMWTQLCHAILMSAEFLTHD